LAKIEGKRGEDQVFGLLDRAIGPPRPHRPFVRGVAGDEALLLEVGLRRVRQVRMSLAVVAEAARQAVEQQHQAEDEHVGQRRGLGQLDLGRAVAAQAALRAGEPLDEHQSFGGCAIGWVPSARRPTLSEASCSGVPGGAW